MNEMKTCTGCKHEKYRNIHCVPCYDCLRMEGTRDYWSERLDRKLRRATVRREHDVALVELLDAGKGMMSLLKGSFLGEPQKVLGDAIAKAEGK